MILEKSLSFYLKLMSAHLCLMSSDVSSSRLKLELRHDIELFLKLSQISDLQTQAQLWATTQLWSKMCGYFLIQTLDVSAQTLGALLDSA